MDNELKVSVIIPTKNGGHYLTSLLSSLKEQSIKPIQILVIDSSSEDNTIKISKSFEVDIIQIEAKAFDHGGTRNLAASRSTGDILVFLTQDTLFKDAKCLENLIKPLADSKIAASYGRHISREDTNPIEKFVRYFNYPSAGMIKGIEDLPTLGIRTFFFSNVCSAVKKNIFEEVGRFPDKIIRNEDMFLAAKFMIKGYKIAYQPDAVVYHSHNYPISILFKRYFDIGVFFSRNRNIVELSKARKEGLRYLKEELRFLMESKQWSWLPIALLDAIVRFVGYRIGLLEKCIPRWLKKKISYCTSFWERDVR